MENWLELVVLLGAALVVAYLVYHYLSSSKGAQRGSGRDLNGPAKAARPMAAARRFCAGEGAHLIAPATLARSGVYADLDFILVGAFGVLCVKCLGMAGQIYGTAGDAKWLQVTGKEGEKRSSFDNPLMQAARDTRLVRDALFSANLKSVPVETVCVFTNRSAQLALPRDTGHYTVRTFRDLLDKDKYHQDRRVDVEKVVDALRENLAPAGARRDV